MLANSTAALAARSAFAFVVVLGIIAVAWFVARRRGTGGSRLLKRLGGPSGPLAVEARVGLTRGTVASAVRFGDQVMLVAAGEGGRTELLATMPTVEWEAAADVANEQRPPSFSEMFKSALDKAGSARATMQAAAEERTAKRLAARRSTPTDGRDA